MSALSRDDVLAALRRGAEAFYNAFPAVAFNTPEWRAGRVEAAVMAYMTADLSKVALFRADEIEEEVRTQLAVSWARALSKPRTKVSS